MKKYGNIYPTKSKLIQDKTKKTNLEKYGYTHPLHNKIVAEKCSKYAYNLKEFIMPSGKCIKVQGYEHFALKYILYELQLNEIDIITSRINVPSIWYILNDKKHRHYVDIYIKSHNKCIEVKSQWTYQRNTEKVHLKQQAAKDLGFEYEIWIYNGKGDLIKKIL